MSMYKPFVAAIALCAGASPVFADPGPESGQVGPYYGGVVELEYNFSDDFGDIGFVGRTDARAGVLNSGNGNVQFGFELGIEGYDFEGPFDLAALQAIVFAVTDYGTFSIGQPFAVVADYGPETLFDRSGVQALISADGRTTVQTLLQVTSQPAPGLRYDGSFGPVSAGLSVHRFAEGDEPIGVSGAASYTGGFFTVTGEVNYVDFDGDDFHTVSLAAESSFGPFGSSLEVFNNDGDFNVYTVEGSYAVNERFGVAAGLREFDTSGPNTAWLVEAEYGFANGAFLNAAAGRSLGNSEASVGIGLEF